MFYLRPFDHKENRNVWLLTVLNQHCTLIATVNKCNIVRVNQEGTRKRHTSKCCISANCFLVYKEKKYLALNAVNMDNSVQQHQHCSFKFFSIFDFAIPGGGSLTSTQLRHVKPK